ncbi:hypothetical protein GQ457_01G023910 [Hibiscus cannabinus]
MTGGQIETKVIVEWSSRDNLRVSERGKDFGVSYEAQCVPTDVKKHKPGLFGNFDFSGQKVNADVSKVNADVSNRFNTGPVQFKPVRFGGPYGGRISSVAACSHHARRAPVKLEPTSKWEPRPWVCLSRREELDCGISYAPRHRAWSENGMNRDGFQGSQRTFKRHSEADGGSFLRMADGVGSPDVGQHGEAGGDSHRRAVSQI